MKDFQIFSDSSCDCPKELMEKYQITRIPYYVSFDQQVYKKEIEELSIPDFYDQLTSEKIFPKTSLPSIEDYCNFFKTALDQGKDVLCFCLSSKFSGSYQSAVTAQNILSEKYPDAAIYIVDSITATGAQGLTVLQAAKLKERGCSITETYEKIQDLKETSRIMFTVGTLEYLQKGGRVGKVSALAGNLLNLKPLIVLHDKELFPAGTVRGRNKSLTKIISMTEEYFKEHQLSYDDYDFCVAVGLEYEDANKVKEATEALIGREISYPLFQIGVTIGTYTGPDAVGVCFIKKP